MIGQLVQIGGQLSGECCVGTDEGEIGCQCCAVGDLVKVAQDGGGHGSACGTRLLSGGVGLGEPLVPLGVIEFVFLGDWIGDYDASAGAGEFAFDECGEFDWVVDADIDLGVGFSEVEGREGVGLVSDDEYAEGFECFAGGFNIED